MTSSLADRVRAAREQWVPAGGHDWLIRRPTRLQLSRFATVPGQLVFDCVIGWKLPENELVPGGGATVPPFDAEAFREWAEDRVALLTELAEHIELAIKVFNERREESEKN